MLERKVTFCYTEKALLIEKKKETGYEYSDRYDLYFKG